MYTTGSINDFANRLHQAVTTGDLVSFITEGRGYLSTPFTTISGVYKSGVLPQVSGAWEQELRLQKFRFTQSGGALMEQQL